MRFFMGIVKIEIRLPEARVILKQFAENRLAAMDSFTNGIKKAAEEAIDTLLNSEIDIFLGKADEKGNKRNGYKEKEYTLKGLGTIRVNVPVDRKRKFNSVIIPKQERMDPRLSEDMAALHLAGLSTRTLSLMSKRILGIEVCPKTVTNSLSSISESADKWLSRDITKKYWALIVDGTNFSVRRRGSVEKEPSLVVIGIDHSNKKSILAIEPGTRDDVNSWKSVFRSLKERGLETNEVKLGLMDGLPGLENLFKNEFSNSVTQRCWFHALQNILAKSPKRLIQPLHQLCSKIMYAPSKEEALERFSELKIAMNKDCQRSVSCLEKDLDSLLAFFDFDKTLWTTLRTTNSIERINKEFKRRTRSMESLGEMTLKSILAFSALRIEMGWQQRSIDTYKNRYTKLREQENGVLNFSLECQEKVHYN
jgi:putative transposase